MNNTTYGGFAKRQYRPIYHTILIIIGLLIIIHNALVIFLYFKRQQLQNETNYLLKSLAHADLLTGLLHIPTMILASVFNNRNGKYLILYFTAGVSSDFILIIVSLAMLLVVSERYMSLCKPYLYPQVISKVKVKYCSWVAWIVSTMIAVVPLCWSYDEIQGKESSDATIAYNRYHSIFLVVCCVFIPSIIMLFAFVSMFKTVRRVTMKQNSKGIMTTDRKAEIKAFFVFLAMFLGHLICWLPLMTVRLYGDTYPEIVNQWPVDLFILMEIFVALRCLSSLINPGIYVWWKPDFRQALQEVYRTRFKTWQGNGCKGTNALLVDSQL